MATLGERSLDFELRRLLKQAVSNARREQTPYKGNESVDGAGKRSFEERPVEGDPLTSRECEVVALWAEGLHDRRVAKQLGISRSTASHHATNILRKLGASTRAQAVAIVLGGAVNGASGPLAEAGERRRVESA